MLLIKRLKKVSLLKEAKIRLEFEKTLKRVIYHNKKNFQFPVLHKFQKKKENLHSAQITSENVFKLPFCRHHQNQ